MTKTFERGAIVFSKHSFGPNVRLHILDRRHLGLGFSGNLYTPTNGHDSSIPYVEVGKTPEEVFIKLAATPDLRPFSFRLMKFAKYARRAMMASEIRLVA